MTATKEEMEKRVQEEATKRAQEALTASLGIQNTLEKCERIRAEWFALRKSDGVVTSAAKEADALKTHGDTLRGLKDLKKLQEQYEQDLSRISRILISKKDDPKLQDLQKLVSPTTLADLQKISAYAEAFPVAAAASAPCLAPAPPIGTDSMLEALFPSGEQAAAAPVAPASAVPATLATLFPSSAPAALLPSSSLLAAAPSPLVATPLVSGSAFAIMQARHEQNKKQEAKLTAEIAALTEKLGKLKAEIEAQEKELPKLQAEQKAKEEKEAKAAKEAQEKASFLQQFQQLLEQAKRLGIEPSVLASAVPAAASAAPKQ